MGGLTIVGGPAGAGKTADLVRRAALRSEADPFAATLALVPTSRHGDQFRRRVVAECGVALGLDVATPALFARRHAPPSAVPPSEVADELLRRAARERIEAGGAAGRFAAIADAPGLYALLGEAVGELVSAAADPAALAGAAARGGDADLEALADVYGAYLRRLGERGWRDPRERPALAAEAIAGGADAAGLVLVDAFEFLNPRELGLVAALAARSEVVVALDEAGSERARWTAERLAALVPGLDRVALPARAAAARTTAHEAFDAEAQLRGIARAIKEALAADPALRPSDCAVAFRRATPHLALARRVFAEYELPFDPAAGERLAERPFGAWVLGLLRLPAHDWRLTRVASLLRSAFLDRRRWGVAADTADRALRAGRAHRRFAGLEALRALPGDLRAEADGAAGRGFADTAARLRAAAGATARVEAGLTSLLGEDASERRTAGAWAAALDDALFGADGLARAAVEDYEGLEVEHAALRADLDALRAIDEALGAPPIALAAFAEELERRMRRPAVLLREAGGVLFAPMHTLHGLRFSRLHLGGLAEGEFPAPRRAASLLGRRAREALRAGGIGLPPEPRVSEDELWAAAASRADASLALWRPRFGDDARPRAAAWRFHEAASRLGAAAEPAEAPPERAASRRELAVALASRWSEGERRRPEAFEAWPLVVREAARAEQQRRSFADAGPREGDLRGTGAGAGLGRLTGEDAYWSASRLESWRTCSFQFFGSYALGLREVEEEDAEAGAAIRGSVVHDIVEDALQPLAAAGRPLVPDTLDGAVRRMRERGPAIWNEAPSKHAFGRAALWRFGWEQTADDIEGLLRREAEANAALGVERVAGNELRIDAALPGVAPALRLTGAIDRVDVGPGFVQIVDYKTGRGMPRSDVESGRRLQLQLYALAAREQLGAERLVARYAWLDPRAAAWSLDSANAEDAALIEEASRHAEAAREAVAAGDFRVRPQTPSCPPWCDFRHVCRVNQFSRRKPWS